MARLRPWCVLCLLCALPIRSRGEGRCDRGAANCDGNGSRRLSGNGSGVAFRTKFQLLRDLVGSDTYIPDEPPFLPDGPPLRVQVGLKLTKAQLDVITGQLDMSFWFRLYWLDHRLLFNGTHALGHRWKPERDYIQTEVVDGHSSTRIWVPDISCLNALEPESFREEGAWVYDAAYSNLTDASDPYNVFYSRPGNLKAWCKMDLSLFPFDHQTCTITFASWIHSPSELVPVLAANPIEIHDESGGVVGYTMSKLEASQTMKDYATAAGWPEVAFSLTLRRQQESYIVNVLGPLCTLILLANLVFWLPLRDCHLGSGERISYAVTLFLTIIALSLFTSGLRPAVAESIWLDRFQTRCIVLTVVPILETILMFYVTNVIDDCMKYIEMHDMCKEGDRVRCRSNTMEDWLDGVVTSVNPVLVRVDGSNRAVRWNHITHLKEDKTRGSMANAAIDTQLALQLNEAFKYDELSFMHKAFRSIDRCFSLCGFRTKLARWLHPCDVDRISRHVYPIVAYIILNDLYREIPEEFWDPTLGSLFGGAGLVGTAEASTIRQQTFIAVFVLQALACYFGVIMLAVTFFGRPVKRLIRWCQGETGGVGRTSTLVLEEEADDDLAPGEAAAGSSPSPAATDNADVDEEAGVATVNGSAAQGPAPHPARQYMGLEEDQKVSSRV